MNQEGIGKKKCGTRLSMSVIEPSFDVFFFCRSEVEGQCKGRTPMLPCLAGYFSLCGESSGCGVVQYGMIHVE